MREILALPVLVTLLSAAPCEAQIRAVADTGSIIATSGNAEVTLPPDRAVISLAVASRAATAALAASANTPRVSRLRGALLAIRPTPDSVLVVAVGVGPNENRERATVVDYEARAVLRLSVRTLDSLGRYLDIALSNGATEVVSVQFDSDSADAARRQALAQAFQEARRDAEAVARAAGGQLGQLLRVSTGPDYGDFEGAAMSFASAGLFRGEAVPLAPQGVRVRAHVSAQWRLVGATR